MRENTLQAELSDSALACNPCRIQARSEYCFTDRGRVTLNKVKTWRSLMTALRLQRDGRKTQRKSPEQNETLPHSFADEPVHSLMRY
jgi:hypothetical protein